MFFICDCKIELQIKNVCLSKRWKIGTDLL